MFGYIFKFLNELLYTILRSLPFIRKPKSKNYLVIGASSGIGRSLVLQLAKSAQVEIGIAIASRKIDDLTELKVEVEKRFPKVKVFVRRYDITHFNDADSIIDDSSKALGSLDTIVVNAGISDISSLGDDDYFKKGKATLDTNLTGPVAVISAFVKYAKKTKIINPYIVTVSSIVSSKPQATLTAYGTSKKGLDFFIEGVHNELYLDGFWTTNIRPGLVATKLNDYMEDVPFKISSSSAAKSIAYAMEKRKKNVIVPYFWTFVIPILKCIPNILSRKPLSGVEIDPTKYEQFLKHTYNKSD